MEWEQQQQQQQQHHHHHHHHHHQQQQQKNHQMDEEVNNNNVSGMFVKVMTDEQMEILRKQIAAYATICEQLVEQHKNLTSHHDLPGVRLGNLYCDSLLTPGGHKITGRQRWTPTPVQLQILERIFDQGNGAPNKQKIREITAELSQHGQISESNVYNWFQNRRARSKRKQQVGGSSNNANNNNNSNNNAESEVETEVESIQEKKAVLDDPGFQIPEMNHGMQSSEPQARQAEPPPPPPAVLLQSEGCSRTAEGFNQMPFYGSMLSEPRDGADAWEN